MKTLFVAPALALLMLLANPVQAATSGGSLGTTVKTDYYRLRVEYTSSTDWTTLTPVRLDMIKAVKLISVTGPVSRYGAQAERLWVVANTGAASVENPQKLVADVAVDKSAITNGLQLTLEKGVSNTATVKIYTYSNDTTYTLAREVVHTGKVAGATTNNPLAVTLSPSFFASAPLLSVYAPAVPKKALAFYYPWFTPIDWTLPEFTDKPTQLYSTAKVADVQVLVDRAISSGLTGFVSSWWGPTDRSNPRFQILLDAIQNKNFEASLYYETLRNGQPLADSAIISELTYALQTYGQHTKFIRWNGRPVIFIWATGRIPSARWKTILATVRQNAGPAYFIGMGCDSADMDVFDGMHDYTVNQAADVDKYEKRCGKKTSNHFMLSANHQRKLWVATAMPGYDDMAILNRATHLVVPRNAGAYYQTTLSAAINSTPDWIVVTSWNEWAENTHIESSVNYGALYQNISRTNFSAWLAQ